MEAWLFARYVYIQSVEQITESLVLGAVHTFGLLGKGL